MTTPILLVAAKVAFAASPAAAHKTDPLVVATWALVAATVGLVLVTWGLVSLTRKMHDAQTKPVVLPRIMRSELPPRGRILIVIGNVGGGAAVGVEGVLHFLPFPANAPPAGRLQWQIRSSVIRPGEDHVPAPN